MGAFMPKDETENIVLTREGLPLQTRSMPVTSVNIEARTVDLCWTTGVAVRRYDYLRDRYFDEVLSLKPEHIRMERLNSGAPLLNTHYRWDLSGQIGVVERAWLKPAEGMATTRFSKRKDADDIFMDVADGIVRNVSVGYIVHTYLIEERDGIPVYLAVDWEPTEISLVPIPADAGGGIRSTASAGQIAESYRNVRYIDAQTAAPAANLPVTPAQSAPVTEERAMPKTNQPGAPAATTEDNQAGRSDSGAPVTPLDDNQTGRSMPGTQGTPGVQTTPVSSAVDSEAERQRGIQQERDRQNTIRTLTSPHGLPADMVRGMIDEGVSIPVARERILDFLAERSNVVQTSGHSVTTIRDETETRRCAMTDSLYHRAFGGDLPESAREFRSMSLPMMAVESIQLAGGSVRGLSMPEIVRLALSGRMDRGMHTTSDFPIALENTAVRSIERGYERAGQTFWPLVRRKTTPDFKEMRSVRFGNSTKLELIPESGKYPSGQINDAVQHGFKLETYGKVLAVSRQAVINDDIGIFDEVFRAFGQGAADLESDMVWALILGDMATPDGKNLFDAIHKNTGSGLISIESIDALDQLIGEQTDPNTEGFINLHGEFLIVPRSLLLKTRQLLGFYTPTKSDDVNALDTNYQVLTDPRIKNKKQWYNAAGPDRAPTIDVLYLEGEEGIQTESQVGFDTDGVEVKGRLDFACNLRDYRWIARSSGQ